MNDRQRKFCEIYSSGTISKIDAYLRVYKTNSRKAAATSADQLLRKKEIANYISELRERAIEANNITNEKIIAQIAKHAFVDPIKFYHDDGTLRKISEIEEDARATIAGLELTSIGKKNFNQLMKIKLTSSLQALEMLGKTAGIFEKDNEQRAGRIIINTIDPGKPVPADATKGTVSGPHISQAPKTGDDEESDE